MFTPKINSDMVIDLPGERLMATVRKVVDRNGVIAELTCQPLGKSHTYKFRELVPVRRVLGMLGETWQAVSQTEMRLAAQRQKDIEAQAAKKKPGGKRAASARK